MFVLEQERENSCCREVRENCNKIGREIDGLSLLYNLPVIYIYIIPVWGGVTCFFEKRITLRGEKGTFLIEYLSLGVGRQISNLFLWKMMDGDLHNWRRGWAWIENLPRIPLNL